MPIITDGLPISRNSALDEYSASLGESLKATADETLVRSPGISAYRATELFNAEQDDTAKRLSQDEARQKSEALGLKLEFPATGITETAANILIQRKQDEIRRNDIMARGPQGFGAGVAKIGTALGASLLDPLNVAAAFVPVVGEARYAKLLADAGSTAARVLPRAAVGFAEGVVGTAALEPIVYGAAKYEQADFGMADAALDVLFGGVFGAGLHAVGGSAADLYRGFKGAPDPFERLRGLDVEQIKQVHVLDDMVRANKIHDGNLAEIVTNYKPEVLRAAGIIPKDAETAAAATPPAGAVEPQAETAPPAPAAEPAVSADHIEHLLALAGNKLTRGDYNQLISQQRDLEYKLQQMDARQAGGLEPGDRERFREQARAENPKASGREIAKIADQLAQNEAATGRQSLQDALDRVMAQIEADRPAREAHSELERIRQREIARLKDEGRFSPASQSARTIDTGVSPATRRNASSVSVAQLAEGRGVEVTPIVESDPAIGTATPEGMKAQAEKSGSVENQLSADVRAAEAVDARNAENRPHDLAAAEKAAKEAMDDAVDTERMGNDAYKYKMSQAFSIPAGEIADALKKAFGGDASKLLESGRVKIVSTVDELNQLTGTVHPEDVQAMYDPRTDVTYLVAEAIDSARVKGVALHEVGVHAGMEKMLGKEAFAKLLDEVNARADAGDAPFVAAREAVPADTPSAHTSEESLAYLVENHPDLPIVKRLLAKVRAWAYRNFAVARNRMKLTDADIVELATAALRSYARETAGAAKAGETPVYSRSAGSQDLPFTPSEQSEDVPFGPDERVRAASASDVAKAEAFNREYGILPYYSEGQLEVPVEVETNPKYSVKSKDQAKHGFDDDLGLALNANGTVTLYFHTTNEHAQKIIRGKRLSALDPQANRVYLTNESSVGKVMAEPGGINQQISGGTVMLHVDPNMLMPIGEAGDFASGRRDFFIPIAEGESFVQKMRKTALFTLNKSRHTPISVDVTFAKMGAAVTEGVEALNAATSKAEYNAIVKKAKAVLLREHNVSRLLTENGKLEKTRVGDYGLTYEGASVVSKGLGLASAQALNEKKLSTCLNAAICEALCLGETSGQNLLYGGEGSFRSGPRLIQYLKTEAFVLHPKEFAILLAHEIKSFDAKSRNTFERVWNKETKKYDKVEKEATKSAIRLNVTSDFPPSVFETLIKSHPEIEFYDYTKLTTEKIADNHHLTYSSTGASQIVNGKEVYNPHSNWNKMVQRMNNGFNVAMAFTDRNEMPKFVLDEATGQKFKVWNGDNYDARFLDPKQEDGIGMIIGLTNKDRTTLPGLAAEKHRGFFIDYDPARDGDTVTIKDQSKFARPMQVAGKPAAPAESQPASTSAPVSEARYSRSKQTGPDVTGEMKQYDEAVKKAELYAAAVRAAADRLGNDQAAKAAMAAAGKGKLSANEINQLLDALKAQNAAVRGRLRSARDIASAEDRADDMQDDAMLAANDLGNNLKLAAIIAKRNAALNIAARSRALSFVTSEFNGNEIEGVKALLAGSEMRRRGARLSVDAQQKAFQGEWMGGIIADMEREGLWDLFVSEGMARETARALYMMGNRFSDFSGIPDEAVRMAKIINKYQEDARLRQNRFGAWVGDLKGYIVRQAHDMYRIRQAGYEVWRDYILPRLDIDATFTERGVTDIDASLRQTWLNLSSGLHTVHEPDEELNLAFEGQGAALAKKVSQSRLLHFKDGDAWFDYNQRFGVRKLADAVLTGLNNASRNSAMMKVLGTNPEAMLTRVMDDLEAGMNASPEARAKFHQSRQDIMNLFAHVSGAANIPGNQMGAKVFAGLRAWESMSKLGGAVISSVTDIPVYAAEQRFMGKSLLSGMGDAITGLTKGRGTKEQKEILASLGVFFESMTHGIAGRFDAEDGLPGRMSKLMSQFFKWNGLTWWTETLRSSAALSLSHHLAQNAELRWGDLSGELRNMMGLYNIDEGKWNLIRIGASHEADGRMYLTPEGVKTIPKAELEQYIESVGRTVNDASVQNLRDDLASALRSLFIDRAHYAVIEPGPRTKAFFLRGTQPGTVWGEVARLIAQFKSFPTAMIQKTWGREIYGRGYDSVGEYLKRGKGDMQGMVHLMLWLTLFGYGAMSVKDLLKGRTPRDPLSPAAWTAAFLQGGGAGIYGDFLFGDMRNRFGGGLLNTIAGPVLGTGEDLADLYGRVKNGDDAAAKAFRIAVNNTPFINMFYTRMALDYLFIYHVQEMLNPGYLRRMERRIEKENAQTFLIKPSEVVR